MNDLLRAWAAGAIIGLTIWFMPEAARQPLLGFWIGFVYACLKADGPKEGNE